MEHLVDPELRSRIARVLEETPAAAKEDRRQGDF
jgi:hypothetical protein